MKIPIRGLVVAFGVVVLVESFLLYKSFFMLPPYRFSANADYINVVGSWIEDARGGVTGAFPLNTAEIVCYKDRGVCIEARAYKDDKSSKFLVSQLLEYKIVKWDPNEVVAILDGGGGTLEIHFDMKRKVVALIDSEKPEREGELPAYAHMGHGQDAKKAAGVLF